MNRQVDFLIVGAGLTGAVCARILVDAGCSVLVVERRSDVGGNVHDHVHASGIRVHTYGPHYFRTVSDEVWTFVNRFTSFMPYEARVKAHVGDEYVNWPLGASYIRKVIGNAWRPEFAGIPGNFEEAAISLMPRKIYELFVKEYNEKQWGVPATDLETDLCKRFDVRHDDDPRLTPQAKYQGLPSEGYTRMIERMLDGIPVEVGVDYLKNRDVLRGRKMTVYTGAIDAFFDNSMGDLQYRGQRRLTEHLSEVSRFQEVAQVNEPLHANGPHIRTIEWKHMMSPAERNGVAGTVVTREIPFSPVSADQFEYPFPDKRNRDLYGKYRAAADRLGDVVICGRLGEYRYYDMDHAIARSLELSRSLLRG